MSGRGRKVATTFLAVLVAGLLALTWRQSQIAIDVAAIAPGAVAEQSPAQDTASPQPEPVPPALSDLSETLSRPLFTPDRRPRVVQPQADSEKPLGTSKPEQHATTEGFRLVGMMGTIKNGKAEKRVLIRSPATPVAKWVSAGADIDGWRIELIGKDRVMMVRGDIEAELLLYAPALAKSDDSKGEAGAAQPDNDPIPERGG